MSVTRPPMLYGPSCFQADAAGVAAAATAAACACIWSTCARVTSALELSLKSRMNSSGVAPLACSSASFSGGTADTMSTGACVCRLRRRAGEREHQDRAASSATAPIAAATDCGRSAAASTTAREPVPAPPSPRAA